jgi:hypothetical protein
MTYAFVLPIKPGMTEACRSFGEEIIEGARRQEYADLQRRLGATKEQYFIQSTPEGDLQIVVGEAIWTPPRQVMDPENNPFDRWFLDQIQEIYGVDLMEVDETADLAMEWPAA